MEGAGQAAGLLADIRRPAIEVAETRLGRGVFVRSPVKAGDRVLEFRGIPIDFAATLAKGDRECDALQIGVNQYLDLTSAGRFVNHSCDPNTGVRNGVHLVALRDLAADEEVNFDYSTTLDEDHWTLECRCESPRCRGTIGDFRLLPRAWKLELIREDIVPEFILAREIESGRLTRGQIDSARSRTARRR